MSLAPSFSGARPAGLRDRLIALASGRLCHPLHIDTVLGMNLAQNNSPPSQERAWFLLFGLHCAFLYDDPKTPDSPRIDSIARFVIDDYPFTSFPVFKDYFSREPFVFLYDLAALDILALLFSRNTPGTVVTVDFKNAEIRTAVAHIHPESSAASHRIDDRDRLHTPLELSTRRADEGWRTGGHLPLDRFVSPDVGLVRQERAIVTESCLAGSLSRVAWAGGTEEALCGAHNLRPASARHVARCEAIERFQVIFQRPDDVLVYAPYDEVRDTAIDPRSMFYGRTLPDRLNPYAAYCDSMPMYWTWADRLTTNEVCLVPAQEIWFNTRRLSGENIVIRPTTNGCALGRSLEEAALFALFELIERDAYLTMWYLRRPCRKVVPESVQFEPFQLLWSWTESAFQNYKLHLFDATSDIRIPVIAAVAVKQKGAGPRTLHAAAANGLAEYALFGALKEVSVSLSSNPESRASENAKALEFLANPALTTNSQDHRSVYSLDEPFPRTSFLNFEAHPMLSAEQLTAISVVQPSEHPDLGETVYKIMAHLEELGLPVLLKDITHSQLRDHQLFCVKAVVPGLFPMWYGHNFIRFAVTDRLRKLASSLVGRKLERVEDFNLDLHPFG